MKSGAGARILLWVSHVGQVPKALGHPPLLSQATQAAGAEVERQEEEAPPMWDAAAHGEDLSAEPHCFSVGPTVLSRATISPVFALFPRETGDTETVVLPQLSVPPTCSLILGCVACGYFLPNG